MAISNKETPKRTESRTSNLALSFGRKESKTDNVELSQEQIAILENIPIPPEYRGKKLKCRIWNEDGTRTIRRPVTIPYGKPYFTCKIGTKSRFFKVNYMTKGMIKNIDGRLYYDIAFHNSLGALALGNIEFPEDMDSAEAYTVFQDNAVNMYVKKGGIPQIYLLVAMAVAGICMIGVIATVPSALTAQEQVKDLDTQVTTLKQENAVIKQQLAQAQQQVNNR